MDDRPADILCFSHLRWDWVYQRPQHLLSRLARAGHRVFYVEEPFAPDEGDWAAPHWTFFEEVAPNVTRCVPRSFGWWPWFLEEAGRDTREMRALIGDLLVARDIADPIVWVYAPLATPIARDVRGRALVYDCMDELSLFKDAPPELLAREEELLRHADLVFTGGRSMYEARLGKHLDLHLFPSSVDAAHFARASAPETAVPDDARPDPAAPTLGFYGVLDERLDLDLVDAIAAARPDWRFVFVGPVAKIDPDSLPQRPNLSYPGMRPYEALPGYLKGWDVCLMPFARNDATRFISPTKTLEYLAADKPIVSTSIRDVVTDYRGVVRIADTPEEFIAACEGFLRETPGERARRRAAGRAILARTSWNATAAGMGTLIDEAARARDLVGAGYSSAAD